MIKYLGAFIQNTIRPMIEELKWILDELNKKGITKEDLKEGLRDLLDRYVLIVAIRCGFTFIAVIMIIATLYKILCKT